MRSAEKLSPLMDTAFALNELHSDPLFDELNALIDELQRRNVLASDGSAEIEMVSAFLDEMKQLDVEMAVDKRTPNAFQSPDSIDPPAARRKKKKVSSTERRKQEKALLLRSINELQRQLHDATNGREQQRRVLEVQCEIKQRLCESQRIQRLLAVEQIFADTVALLLRELHAPMKHLTYTEGCPGLQDDVTTDAALFDMLQHNVDQNYACLVQKWRLGCIPLAVNEAVDATVSPDGNALTCKLERFIPFDVSTVTDTAWRSVRVDFCGNASRTIVRHGVDIYCVKEELTIHPAGQGDVTLCIRTAMRRIVHERSAVFLWETVADWSTPSCSECTTTQESGWVLIRPAEDGDSVSVIQSLMKVTLSKTSKVWMQLMHPSGVMLNMVLPSFQHILMSRLQRFENRLLDETRLAAVLP